MNEMQQKVSAIGVVPVIKLTNPTRDAGPLSDALCAGGVLRLPSGLPVQTKPCASCWSVTPICWWVPVPF